MALDAAARAVVLGYAQRITAIRQAVLAFIERTWGSLGSYREADINRFVAALVPVVEGAQAQVATFTDAYLAAIESQVLGIPARPVGVPRESVTTEALRGVPAADVYRRAGQTVWWRLSQGDAIEVAQRAGLRRAQTIAATDMQLAKTHTSRRVMESKGNIVGYRRVLTGSTSCGLCVVASTQRYTKSRLLPIHAGCVPSGTLVVPPANGQAELRDFGGCHAVTRRWYAGELVVLRLASGDTLTVTPNHPVLAPQGWVPADLVREGDDLFRSKGTQGDVGRGPHEGQRPALIEDVWRSFLVEGRLVRMPLAAEDFHGDESDGEVDVVWADGHLAPEGDSPLGEEVGELLLVGGHRARVLLDGGSSGAALSPRGLATASRFVGGSSLGPPLLEGHATCPIHAGGAAPTRFDAPAEKFSLQSAPVYAQRGVDLQRRLAGLIQSDRLVEKTRVRWSGHVYNLHTVEGWYSANSHIVSNCDCGVVPIWSDRDPGRVISDAASDVQDQLVQRFGVDAKDVNDPATLRRALVEHDHSEVGPVLSVRGQSFRGPSEV